MTDRHETLRRLGATMGTCPVCCQPFMASRLPRHWVMQYRDGELYEEPEIDGYIIDDLGGSSDLACSEACARLEIRDRELEAADGDTFSYHREESR